MRCYCWMSVLFAAMVGCQTSEPPVELLTESYVPPPAPVPAEVEIPELRPPELDWKVVDSPAKPEPFDPRVSIGIRLHSGPRGGFRQRQPGPIREQAVMAALKWLAAKQTADGGWSFDGQASRQRPHDRVTATSLVALSFLGAGQSHRLGQYKQNVERAIRFLLRETRTEDPPHGPTWERSFALVLPAIVFCELQAQSPEPGLTPAMQRMCDLTFADIRGDAAAEGTLSAWRLLALREAYITKCNLTSADSDEIFRATAPGEFPLASPSPAAGLQQLLALNANPANDAVIQSLARRGSTGRDLADDFLACTLFACAGEGRIQSEYGRPIWKRLVETQAQPPSPEAGSWYFADDLGGRTGGRVYCTALAALTIETYYQHLQIFRRVERPTPRPLD